MGFDEISRIVELIFSFVGLVFVVFGWIIPYRQTRKAEIIRKKDEVDFRRRQWEKDLIDRQIAELYGPLSELLREQRIIWDLILYQLGRKSVFNSEIYKLSELPEGEQKVWVHYVDTYKIPLSEYVLGWELLDNQKKNNVPNYYEYYYRYNYPSEFDKYIFETLEKLRNKQEELVNA